jgi:DNA-binding NarL/FixJ family response regulator
VEIVVLTPVRLLGDGLAACVMTRPGIVVRAAVSSLSGLRDELQRGPVDLVLIDVTQGIDLYDVRSIAAEYPEVALVALGLNEQRQEVIRCGRAGFVGYIGRDASVDVLCDALFDVIHGRLACPAEISSGLLKALFRREEPVDAPSGDSPLTVRESEVLQLIGHGHSNKEIARDLNLSVATVKHHVHNILEKLHLPRRAQAMRKVRDSPWLGTTSSSTANARHATRGTEAKNGS